MEVGYAKFALKAIIDQQQDHKTAVATLCASVGKNLSGIWGAIGQEGYRQFALI